MPRIDNSQCYIDIVNQEILDMWGPSAKHFLDDFCEEDPGKTPPIDLCQECFDGLVFEGYVQRHSDEIDHPDYDDAIYQCVVCGEILEQEEDW